MLRDYKTKHAFYKMGFSYNIRGFERLWIKLFLNLQAKKMGTFDLGTLVNLTLNPNQNFFIFCSTPRCEPNKTFFLFNSTRSAGERPRDTDKEQFLQNSCLACQLNCFSTKDRGTLSHQLLEIRNTLAWEMVYRYQSYSTSGFLYAKWHYVCETLWIIGLPFWIERNISEIFKVWDLPCTKSP